MSELFDQSFDGSEEPLIRSQDLTDLTDISAENIENKSISMNTEETDDVKAKEEEVSEKSDEWIDRLEKNLPKVRFDSSLLSQELIPERIDHWKGSPVVNYKKFKKFSQNSSQSNQSVEQVVRLKRVDNTYHKDCQPNPTEDNIDINIDLNIENGIKRKYELDLEVESEASEEKKSRH